MIRNYLKNSEEIIKLAEDRKNLFSIRTPDQPYNFVTRYGSSSLKSLFSYKMDDEIKAAILKTLPKQDHSADITINRYDPGDFLKRHRDSQGAYWKFKLIFLRSDEDHFVWYDENNEPNLVKEEPGMYLEMPIHLEHEVTTIGEKENPKYSLVLSWGLR
jgi:hypothetical protein